MPHYNVTGIVLRRMAYGETDNILTIYTRELGRVSAIAKGSRRATSRTAGACEILTCARFNLASGKSLDVVTQTEIVNAFPALRKDLARLANGQYLAEILDKLVADGDPHAELFILLRSALLLLERSSDPATAARWFELRILGEVGFAPDLGCCVACGEAVPAAGNWPNEEYALSVKHGGAVCARHTSTTSSDDHAPLSPDALDFLQHVDAHDIGNIRSVLKIDPPSARTASLARNAMRRYIRWRIDSDLRSVAFLDSLTA